MSISNGPDTQEIETEIDEEKQHAHHVDVTDGGLMGAVGGGIIGALAGGPVGAVIGAVVGGGASAFAVDVIDEYDHAEPTAVQATAVEPRPSSASDAYDSDVTFVAIAPVAEVYVLEDFAEVDLLTTPSTEDQIRYRAYELWEMRGHRIGFDKDDWFDAEKEVKQQQHDQVGVSDLENLEEVEDTVGYSS